MLRHFVRIFLTFSVFTILFIIPHGSTSGANSVRWAEIDKGVASYAYRAGPIMVQKDKISSIDQVYGSLMFDGISWSVSTDPTKFPRSDYMGNMFLDSRGIIYAGGVRADYDRNNTPYSYIFESTDGLNFAPVQPFVDVNGEGIIWNFTEDKYGNVWAGEFTSHNTTTGAHLWRRRPSGVWTNVANWGPPEFHIHNVYYDPYRDALYVAIGDQDHGILKLPSDKVNADGISESDFSFIVPRFADNTPVEVTAITSDEINIYVGMDMHSPYGTTTRAISIITDDNINQTINVSYPLEGCAIWHWADVDDAGNVIFSSRGINEWDCTDNYVNQIVVSSDHGSTWTVVKDFGSSSTSIGLAYTGLASHYASNWSGLYGGGNGWGGTSLRATIARVLPTGTTFYVDGSNGVDWTNFGIDPLNPVKSLNYLELLNIQPGDTVQFINSNTYTDPLVVGWSGDDTTKISLRGNPESTFTGGNADNPPAVAETFESAKDSWNFYLNETGGTITEDTSIVHSGAQSAKVVRETGRVSLELKNVAATNINEGSTMYLSYWLYYPTDQTSNSDPGMLRIIDNSNYEIRLRLFPLSESNLLNEVVVNIPARSSHYIPARQSLASGTWHKIYIEDYLHPTSGSLKLYVDNTLWLNINGVKTVTAGGKLNSIYFYNYENPVTYYIDDLNFGKSPIEARGAISINGYSFLDIGGFRFQGTNGIILSGNSTDINIYNSIFDRLTSDAIASHNNANLNLYYNSIYGSGRYGIYTSGSGSLINNVVYNSFTNDIFIDAGTSVTGSNNWFMDSGYGGTGTYFDAGNTTWSGADPAFVDSGSGDFHLLSTSPLVDIGIPIDGVIYDFDGSLRPQGTAPDIGAYETPVSNNVYLVFVCKG